ncbi:hypothetical protein Nepgr_009349 [Nepenthes gracilis]|uniref:Secreted protein n=1 Tax=Nepenthes gracilis TaxID=150966 RepID=A0AAD3SBC0_NEPGR|nr:hypothetical protein Nepgr_009349 [Nepenthes gracilis]
MWLLAFWRQLLVGYWQSGAAPKSAVCSARGPGSSAKVWFGWVSSRCCEALHFYGVENTSMLQQALAIFV